MFLPSTKESHSCQTLFVSTRLLFHSKSKKKRHIHLKQIYTSFPFFINIYRQQIFRRHASPRVFPRRIKSRKISLMTSRIVIQFTRKVDQTGLSRDRADPSLSRTRNDGLDEVSRHHGGCFVSRAQLVGVIRAGGGLVHDKVYKSALIPRETPATNLNPASP